MKSVAFVYLSNYKNWPLGGMLNYVLNILPFVPEYENVKVDIWGGNIVGEKQNEDIFEYTKIKIRNKLIPNFIRSFWGIIRHRKEFAKYDIVYSHTSATTIALKLCFPSKFVVHHQHGLSYKYNHGIIRILNIGYFIAQKVADVSLFVASEEEVRRHHQIKTFRDKSFYSIGSPVDIKRYDNRKCNDFNTTRFIYTGRIDPWKNVMFLVHSFMEYKKRDEKATLTIIGDGPDYNHVKEEIIRLKMDKSIIMKGRLNKEEISEELCSSDVFVFASKGEGVSLSMIEALAAGLPIVGFDVIGVRDFIIPGKTGYFSEDDTPEKFALAMRCAKENCSKMIEDCKKSVEKYDSKVIADRIYNIIQSEYKKVRE